MEPAAPMLFWIAIATLVALVTFAVTRPLLAPPSAEADRDPAELDIAIYRDQLAEIERERERGAISDADAASATDEVSRRLLRLADTASGKATPKTSRFAAPLFYGASLLLPAISLAAYLNFGTPGLPAQPLAERLALAPKAGSNADLIAKVEAALRVNPEDGKGWDVIGPVYLASGRYDDAAIAFANANRLLGESPKRLMGFADARIRAQNGIVPDDARKALQNVVAAEPQRPEPRIWLGLAKEQDGNLKDAAADYQKLLADGPADAPWRQAVEERLAIVTGQKPAPAPTAPQAVNPQNDRTTSDAREKMINDMVAGLAERLKGEKTDLVGWQKLIRAYQVLGDETKAKQALSDARLGLAGDATKLQQLNAWLKENGFNG